MTLDPLRMRDGLKEIPFPGCPAYVHDDHRFVLPLIFYAQEQGSLTRPSKLIMIDGHHDARLPRKRKAQL